MPTEDQLAEHIAGELHDGVVQWLVGSKMQAEALKSQVARGEPISADNFDALLRSLQSGMREARCLMRGLAGPQIENGLWCNPLVDELHSLNEANAANGALHPVLEFHFERNIQPLAEESANTVYRLIREAVWNALRHAKAKHVRVFTAADEDGLSVKVHDDGIGFDPNAIPSSRMGIRGLLRRCKEAGGIAMINAAPGKGAEIEFRIPFSKNGIETDGP